jgi:hypothetical protein
VYGVVPRKKVAMSDLERFAASALVAALLFSACSSDSSEATKPRQDAARASDAGPNSGDATLDTEPPAEPGRWVGEVEDSDVRVGIVADATRARLFFCGGAGSYATATRWFAFDEIAEGSVHFADDTWQVNARIEPRRVSGDVTHDNGEVRVFSAERVAPGTLAGLYEGQADCGRLGLIVVQPNKNTPIAAQGACVGSGHAPEQVNPILPVAQDVGAIAVQAPGVEAATVHLHALQLPPP